MWPIYIEVFLTESIVWLSLIFAVLSGWIGKELLYRMLWVKFISRLYSSLCNCFVCIIVCIMEVSNGSIFILNGMVG